MLEASTDRGANAPTKTPTPTPHSGEGSQSALEAMKRASKTKPAGKEQGSPRTGRRPK